MQSYLNLKLGTTIPKIIYPDCFPHFSSWQIPHALSRLFNLSNGQFLQQSLSKHLVHIDLFEYALTEPDAINFTKENPAIIMFIMLEGQAKLFDSCEQFITEITGACYYLTYVPKGNYTLKLNARNHKLLILTPRPDWFIPHLQSFEEFNSLPDHYHSFSPKVFSLPYCPLKKNIVHRLRNVFQNAPIGNEIRPFAVSTFLLYLVKSYQEMLTYNNMTTNAIHQAKAESISFFIAQNFKDRVVDDTPGLAQYFGISIRNLHRLSRIAFGKPLKEQIILLRLDYSMDLIINTNKKIREIALLSGYNDSHYFSRAFKKHFNQNPASIRLHSKIS